MSLLQHPLGPRAPAPRGLGEHRDDHPLGIIPHQIRGYLSNFENKVIRGNSYDCCSACSDKIVDTYKSEGWSFVKKAMNDKGYVEELSGLLEVRVIAHFLKMKSPWLTTFQVQRAAEKASVDLEWSDDGEDDDGDGEMI